MVRQDVNHKQYIRAIILLLVWLIFLPALSLAENEQYHGGSYDGYDAEVRNEIQLNGLDFSFVCHGGSYDGYDAEVRNEIQLSGLDFSFLYHGGSYDGYDADIRNEILLSGLDFSFICHGGSYDGYDAEVRNEILLNGLDFSFICHGGSYDGYDMCIVEEIPLSNGIPCPENVVISISSNTVHIEWNAVSGASSYKVYSSDDLYSGFVEDTSGTFVGTSWSAQVSEEKKFYYITAETGRNSDMTTITPHTYIR